MARFRLSDGVRISAFDASVQGADYLLTLRDGTAFRISRESRDLFGVFEQERSPADAARAFSMLGHGSITEQELERFVRARLVAQGVLEETGAVPGGAKPVRDAPRTLLFRFQLIGPGTVNRIARALAVLYNVPAATTGLLAIVLAYGYLYLGAFPAPHAYRLRLADAPAAYLLLALSMMVHEFGHAAAVRRYGEENGGIGFGMLMIFPVFYADVTSIWRFNRFRRALVDVGGMYFQLLLNAVYILSYRFTGWTSLLLTARVANFLMLYNLLPVLRLDGYWLCSDLIGLPDLHNRAVRMTLALLDKCRGRGGSPARVVVKDVRNPRVAIAGLGYAVLCQFAYLGFFVYIVKTCVIAITRYPVIVQRTGEALAHVASTGGIGAAFLELVRLALSSGVLLFVTIVILSMVRMARRRPGAKTTAGPLL